MRPPISLEQVDELPSTSAALRHRAESGEGEVALLARRQTAGTGRLGRPWVSVAGNLYLSVLLRPASAVIPGHWSLLAAVALADCVAAEPGIHPRLKWPNDVMLPEGKLAGILLDLGIGDGATGPAWLVIGFGVNLAAPPPGLDRPVASLGDPGPPPEPAAFARHLLSRLQTWRQRYEAEGFQPVRTAWLDRGPATGAPVAVGSPAGRIEGRFQGIGSQGEMLLEQGGTVRPVVSGEVE